MQLSPESTLPLDHHQATLIGRLWLPGVGALPVAAHQQQLFDLSPLAPTTSQLLERETPAEDVAQALAEQRLRAVADLPAVLDNSNEAERDTG